MNRGTILVTCGPGSEPLDEVRRITNHSTGKLGLLLTHAFAAAGYRVIVCRGRDASVPSADFEGNEIQIVSFRTNEELKRQLVRISNKEPQITAIFHAAALCDFTVVSVTTETGEELVDGKISSRLGDIVVRMRPAEKIIVGLREWFPNSRIVGWKFEVEGDRETLMAKGDRQIDECRSDACVLNGRAYGAGFGFYRPGHDLEDCHSGLDLARCLMTWLSHDAVHVVSEHIKKE